MVVVTGNPSLPIDVLVALAHDTDPDVRLTVARHAACPDAVIEQFADDPHTSLRQFIASRVDRAQLARFLGDPAAEVRDAVARRPDAPAAILDGLVADPSTGVRIAVAIHRQASDRAVTTLAADADPDVRRAVLARPGLPTAALAAVLTAPHDERPGPAARHGTGR